MFARLLFVLWFSHHFRNAALPQLSIYRVRFAFKAKLPARFRGMHQQKAFA